MENNSTKTVNIEYVIKQKYRSGVVMGYAPMKSKVNPNNDTSFWLQQMDIDFYEDNDKHQHVASIKVNCINAEEAHNAYLNLMDAADIAGKSTFDAFAGLTPYEWMNMEVKDNEDPACLWHCHIQEFSMDEKFQTRLVTELVLSSLKDILLYAGYPAHGVVYTPDNTNNVHERSRLISMFVNAGFERRDDDVWFMNWATQSPFDRF